MMGLLMVVLDKTFPQGGSIWRDWVTEHSTLVYFCEPATVEALFRQKVDTYSNLGFFFGAMLLYAFARADRRTEGLGFATVHPIWSFWYGSAMLVTFLGSTFFHASLTLQPQPSFQRSPPPQRCQRLVVRHNWYRAIP